MDRRIPNPDDRIGEAKAVIKIEIGNQHLRKMGGLLDEETRRAHMVSFEAASAVKPACFVLKNLIRDPEDQPHATRLFLRGDAPGERTTLVIPGLDVNCLYEEAEEGDPWGPMSIARVFTGEDSTPVYRQTPFRLPLGFYLEWAYVKNGHGISLKSLEKRNANGTYTPLPTKVTNTHAANLALWYAGEHRPKVDAAPTHKPFMEDIYRRASRFHREIAGAALFGTTIWKELQARHREIMAVDERLRY